MVPQKKVSWFITPITLVFVGDRSIVNGFINEMVYAFMPLALFVLNPHDC